MYSNKSLFTKMGVFHIWPIDFNLKTLVLNGFIIGNKGIVTHFKNEEP